MLFQIVDRDAQLPRDFGNLMVLQQPQVLGDDLLRRRALEPEVAQLEQQTFLQVAGGDADRVEALDQPERALDVPDRPRAHRGQFVERRDQITVVGEVADDRRADFPYQRVVALHRELPHQVVSERTGG